jgi:hypothetical protein
MCTSPYPLFQTAVRSRASVESSATRSSGAPVPQHHGALQLLRRQHRRTLRDVQRTDARRLSLDDAERHRHPALRRHEHRVHLRLANPRCQ